MTEEHAALSPHLHLGTSSWTAKGWLGTFYPSGTKPADFLAHYARRYTTVEIDATFYATPPVSTVAGWRDKTPDGFLFAAKAPQAITHEKFLEDCEHELHGFLEAMSGLGPKLGPILFQFPYFAKKQGVTEDEFLTRLVTFLKTLPKAGYRFAVEVRNKTWMNPALFEILHDHGVACCLIDHPWMSPPDQLFKHKEIVTAPFAYVRWLGDRYGIEKITKVWNQTVVDRSKDLDRWVPHLRALIEKKTEVFGYVNNHYGGYAPADIDALIGKLAEAGR
jgi:uncharacterized protein YecE (DUF72 family)